jgi:hypothetical protein
MIICNKGQTLQGVMFFFFFFLNFSQKFGESPTKKGKRQENTRTGRAPQRRFLAWIIAVVMLAAYSWNPVPGLHGLFTGLEGLKSMAFLYLEFHGLKCLKPHFSNVSYDLSM